MTILTQLQIINQIKDFNMDKELVVRKNLAKEMIKSGERFIERLDQSSSNVEAALCFFSQDEKIWKVIIISQ